MTYETGRIRDLMSIFWHQRTSKWSNTRNFSFGSRDQYTAFCVAKDWIQDLTEALHIHRCQGFSSDRHVALLEYMGVLQAAVSLQDAIKEMNYAFYGTRDLAPKPKESSAWKSIRYLRNSHSAHANAFGKGSRNATHEPRGGSVIGAGLKSYSQVSAVVYEEGNAKHPKIDLGSLLDAFDAEAASYLKQHQVELSHR